MRGPEERWNTLHATAKSVLKASQKEYIHTSEMLNALEEMQAAIVRVEAERICGHRYIDGECDCKELNSVRK